MALRPGARLGPYEIIAPLGAGGMGEVYRARDTRLNREVALKVLRQAAPYEVSRLRRFEQEARALAALNHPNLLVIFDVGEAEGTPYLASELLAGEPLDVRLRQGAIAPRKAVELARQIAAGLAAAHEQGIVHRDLKPANLFLTNDGRVKILDFGLAKLTETASAEAVTQAGPAEVTASGVTLGTVGYMSPEQVKGETVDARTDIFAFGAVLYEMLTGQRAFKRDTAAETMTAILREEPAENPATAPTSAPALDKIIRRCLEKTPRQRFQSANDLGIALELALGSTMTSGASSIAPAGRRWPMVTAIAVAVAVGAGAWWLARRSGTGGVPTWQQLTFQSGMLTGARFLPDDQGYLVSLQGGNAGAGQVYTGRLVNDGLQPLNAAGEGVTAVSKSGEALLLANVQEFGGEGALSRLSLDGDAPRPVLDHIAAADWSPDGQNMVVVRRNAAANQETLEYPPGHVLYTQTGWINSVRFSPDGRQIAFMVHDVYPDDRGQVAVIDLAGHARRLTPRYASVNGLAWAPGGDEIWYTAAPTGILRAIYAVDMRGHVRRMLAGPTTLFLEDVAPDGRALVASSQFRTRALVVTPHDPGGRDLSIQTGTTMDAISDDGSQALVTEYNTAIYSSYLRGSNGGAPLRLGNGYGEAISPDGRWVLLQNPDANQLTLVPTGAGEPRSLVHGNILWNSTAAFEGDEGADSFWPDSQSLAVIGIAPGQLPRAYRLSLQGDYRPLTPPGDVGTWVTPDGKAVLAQTPGGQWLLVPATGGAAQAMTALKAGDIPLRFGASNDELYVANSNPAGTEMAFLRLNLASGQRQLLASVRPTDTGFVNVSNPVISRDGRSYGYTELTEPGSLYLVSGLH